MESHVFNRRNPLRSSAALGATGAGQSVGSPDPAASETAPGDRAAHPEYVIEVFRTLHSQVGGYGFAPAGTRTEPPRKPTRLRDLVEGGSLAYQITVGDRLPVVFLSGTADFAEREVAGAHPDVLVLGASGHATVHDYYRRVLTTLDWPEVVIPTHHDDLSTPLTSPDIHDTVDREQTRALQDLIGKHGIALDPRHLEPIHL